jgi:protocatechuate 3,4-dioxygenase beta subunit
VRILKNPSYKRVEESVKPILPPLAAAIEATAHGIKTFITGPDSAFRFHTIVPALYSSRTRHYHVKVQAPGSRLLTTQLYFPNEPANLRDVLFQSELLMRIADAGDDLNGRFDFVLDVR